MKPKVYVETTIIGYLTSWPSGDLIVAGRQKITRDWWRHAQKTYDLLTSELVHREAGVGDSEAVRDRAAVLKDLAVLGISQEAEELAARLLDCQAVPSAQPEDALHIAIAVANGIEYLVTWNFKHIANATMRSKIERVCAAEGYDCSTICTPEELLEPDDEN